MQPDLNNPSAPRHDAPAGDVPRHDAPRDYSLTIDDVAARFDAAGLPRSLRTLQRYCASGRLDALKTETIQGEQYFVDPLSVDRAITELKQLTALTQRVATEGAMSHDTARQDAPRRDVTDTAAEREAIHYSDPAPRQTEAAGDMSEHDAHLGHHSTAQDKSRQAPPGPAEARHDATSVSFMTRYVERIEAENSFLREQVDRKDQQIASLLERDKETNFLVRGLQQMLSPLLGTGSRPSDRP